MRPNWRSSGVATDDAIVSGSAPGRLAETEMVGNSTCGSGATGSFVYASAPAMSSPALRSEVPTGRRMKGSEKLMPAPGAPASCRLEERHPAALYGAAAGSRWFSRLEGGAPMLVCPPRGSVLWLHG